MAALRSRVATLVSANTAIARETQRIADLPANISRVVVFIRDFLIWGNKNQGQLCAALRQNRCPSDNAAQQQASTNNAAGDTLKAFRSRCPDPLAEEAIAGLGLTDDDLLNIADLFCYGHGSGHEGIRELVNGVSQAAVAASATKKKETQG